MKFDEKNIHAGHRERLLELVFRNGLENLSPIQQVEYILTFVFPRGDVNPLAHRLLAEYQTVSHILDANYIDLMRIKGLNERSAKKLSTLKDVSFLYTTGKMVKSYPVKNKSEIIDIVEDNLRFRNTEHMLLIAISAASSIIQKRLIDSGMANEVGINLLEIPVFLLNTKATSLVVAHCHPYGSATPSEKDEAGYRKIKDLCGNCGVELIDSYIVGENGVFSQSEKMMKRIYHDFQGLKAAFEDQNS